jgi:hypothetical protein
MTHADDGSKDRPVDEKAREIHRALGSRPCRRSSEQFHLGLLEIHRRPRRMVIRPLITTRSSGCKPSRTIRRPSSSGPSVTFRCIAFPSGPTT